MKNRIKELIEKEKVTAAQFAQEIGIAASSLHHIVTGRNNPSLEVIQKVLERYPQINAEWLVNGRGDRFKPLVQGSLFDLPTDESEEDKERNLGDVSLIMEDKIKEKNSQINDNKAIEKIVIFYKDKSFEVYNS